jgi:hypothetical protein
MSEEPLYPPQVCSCTATSRTWSEPLLVSTRGGAPRESGTLQKEPPSG